VEHSIPLIFCWWTRYSLYIDLHLADSGRCCSDIWRSMTPFASVTSDG